MLRVFFYKSVHAGLPGIYNRGVKIWTRSRYSHCELQFSDGVAASASYMDGGVRFKQIDFNPDSWDVIDLPDHLEDAARAWFTANHGAKYDLLGNLHFVFSIIGDDQNKWFCSEAVAAALGLEEAWRFSPAELYPVLKMLAQQASAQSALNALTQPLEESVNSVAALTA